MRRPSFWRGATDADATNADGTGRLGESETAVTPAVAPSLGTKLLKSTHPVLSHALDLATYPRVSASSPRRQPPPEARGFRDASRHNSEHANADHASTTGTTKFPRPNKERSLGFGRVQAPVKVPLSVINQAIKTNRNETIIRSPTPQTQPLTRYPAKCHVARAHVRSAPQELALPYQDSSKHTEPRSRPPPHRYLRVPRITDVTSAMFCDSDEGAARQAAPAEPHDDTTAFRPTRGPSARLGGQPRR